MSKARAIFIIPTRSSFIRVDEAILGKRFQLSNFYLAQDVSKLAYLARMLMMIPLLLCKPKTGLVVIWFADYHAAVAVFISRLLGSKTLIFVGGYDAVCYPELGMGVYTKALRGFCASFALRHCDRIIVNHQALAASDNLYYSPQGHPEGVQRLVPGLRTPIDVVHNAITTTAPISLKSDRNIHFLAVGSTPRYMDVLNKGYDLLIDTARRMPEHSFVIVGIRPRWFPRIESNFKTSSIPNLRILPPLPQAKVFELMQDSLVFAQPSISEGMPNALMEAMLMGCVPVGSSVAGIPMIIGDFGIVFDARDVPALHNALTLALKLVADRDAISKSISDRFSVAKRETGILGSIDQMM
ncbi:MAG: glycosyltransferase family 4 protein [Candidatus Cloacimonadaceae bacterium]|nr:glycosyltransferase family 4 protein [Candidatus Cloacimonadaceae bacterium]